MTSMAEKIYNTLMEDPDLDVREDQTREEVAKSEAEYRARQYINNVQALSLASEPLKETLNKTFPYFLKG